MGRTHQSPQTANIADEHYTIYSIHFPKGWRNLVVYTMNDWPFLRKPART